MTKQPSRIRRAASAVRSPMGQRAWLAVISLVLFLGLLKLDHVVSDQKASRLKGQRVNCALISSVIDAGRGIILSGTEKPPPAAQERLFERLGLPPYAERRAQAQAQAQGYANGIAQAVQRTSGEAGIIRPNGSIDCTKLRAAVSK